MATSLIEAVEAWEHNKTLSQEPLIPLPVIFDKILSPGKKKYDSPFPLITQKKAESPKLKWPDFPELKKVEEEELLVFKQPELENVSLCLRSSFTVEGKMRNEFDTYGCISVPAYMGRDSKNRFGGGKAITPVSFKEIMLKLGVSIEHVYSGFCHVDYTKPKTIFLFPKKLFAYMARELKEFNYSYEYVIAHELIHMAGSPKRLNRNTIATNVAWYEYHKTRTEECIAIIGSAKLLVELGYEMSSKMSERHKNILADWSEGNEERLEEAEKKATEAVNYLLTGEIKGYKSNK